MMKFWIETYGCQMNVYDSEIIETILFQAGHAPAGKAEEANIVLLNTCAVREHAEQRVLGRTAQLNGLRAQNQPFFLIVCGCMAQRMAEEILQKLPFVDFVIGPDNYYLLPELLKKRPSKKAASRIFVAQDAKQSYRLHPVHKHTEISAFISVMRGCNNFCTYCIVPYTRGRERSRPAEILMEEAENLAKNGFPEIFLLGQNVNSYLDNGLHFDGLLKKIAQIDAVKRIRFTTSHPKDMSDGLIRTIAETAKICNHIHLPVQSGSTAVLKKMNRQYSAEHYRSLISKIRHYIPQAALTTDIIVGFPGETEHDYQETVNLMKEVRYDHAFMFKYSPREGTKAAQMADSVPEDVKQQRLMAIIDMQTQITTEKNAAYAGTVQEVLVESVSKRDAAEMCGRAETNKTVVFPGDESLIGKMVLVRVEEASGWTLRGEIVE